MARTVNLCEYLPKTFRSIREYNEIFKAENPKLQSVWNETVKLLSRTFIETADEAGIRRFEQMLGIVPIAGDDLESRRMRLRTIWIVARPFTMNKLHEILKGLCGENNYEITLDSFELTVKIALGTRNQIDIVSKMLTQIVPANIKLTVTLLYNTWDMFSSQTWNQIKTHDWEDIKEGVS